MGVTDRIPVWRGSEEALVDEVTPQDSQRGTQRGIEEHFVTSSTIVVCFCQSVVWIQKKYLHCLQAFFFRRIKFNDKIGRSIVL